MIGDIFTLMIGIVAAAIIGTPLYFLSVALLNGGDMPRQKSFFEIKQDTGTIYKGQGEFTEISIYKDNLHPSGRFLLFNEVLQGYVDLEDPSYLRLDYIRIMASIIAIHAPSFQVDDIRVLFVGGGTFTLPRYIAAAYPNARMQVFEIDSKVVEAAERFLGFSESPNLRVRIGDAAKTIENVAGNVCDFIICDAYIETEITPNDLRTVEFYQQLRRVLREDGLLLINVFDVDPFVNLRIDLASIKTAFRNVALIWPDESDSPTSQNIIVIAGNDFDYDLINQTMTQLDIQGNTFKNSAVDAYVAGSKPRYQVKKNQELES